MRSQLFNFFLKLKSLAWSFVWILSNLFLIRTVLYIEHRGITRLTDILAHCITTMKDRNEEENRHRHDIENMKNKLRPTLNEDEATVITNTLKVLFNCTCAANPEQNTGDEELMSNLSDLCKILHSLLTLEAESYDLKTSITR